MVLDLQRCGATSPACSLSPPAAASAVRKSEPRASMEAEAVDANGRRGDEAPEGGDDGGPAAEAEGYGELVAQEEGYRAAIVRTGPLRISFASDVLRSTLSSAADGLEVLLEGAQTSDTPQRQAL